MPSTRGGERPSGGDRYSEVQRRTIEATMVLFAEHGVRGTSFSMIAESLGVTKAAVYHQFRTKDSLVLAVAEVGLAPLEDALAASQAEPDPERARLVLLEQIIDLAVANRGVVDALQGDPVMIQLLGTHPPFVDLMNRLYAPLLGTEPTPATLMRTAIVSAAIGAAIVHPLVGHFDEATLRTELLAVTRRLFDLPD